MQIGATLKRKREAKKLSQQEVADFLNISQKTYCNMESNKSDISIEQLSNLGEYLEFDVMEELEKQGIVFNQNNKKGNNNGIVVNNIDEVKALYEKIISEKDNRIKEKDDLLTEKSQIITLLQEQLGQKK